MADELPQEIKDIAEKLSFAKAYNAATGANITHRDVENLGYMESEMIIAALSLNIN